MEGEGGQVRVVAGDNAGGLSRKGGFEKIADEPAVAELPGTRANAPNFGVFAPRRAFARQPYRQSPPAP